MSQLRIIAGKLRSRKIIFTEALGLRPTHDRIRETLFNWLDKNIIDAICLDCFAGSGALGFEALSRGAKYVTFVDNNHKIIEQLKLNAKTLDVTKNSIEFLNANFQDLYFTQYKNKFNIIFLDPPFKQNLVSTSIALIEKYNLLKANALVYIEFEINGFDLTQLPKNWKVRRRQHTKTIEYCLCDVIF
ncbi:MAG: hypothetical protein ACD_29C00307G0004 [uncultured bacterium]|nr:MAG: hypothetical protein ACD_29C00307G0004 [uncultured bacterium]